MKKQSVILSMVTLSLILVNSPVFAQVGPTDADQFAVQAGVIAGATEACGQDVTTFVSRVNEVVGVLSKNASEQQQAMTAFEMTMAKAQLTQSRNHVMNCAQVIQSYNSLPLLRSDYKTTVLAKMSQGQYQTTSTTSTTAPAVDNTMAAPTTVPTAAAPAAPATAFPIAPPPPATQAYVSASSSNSDPNANAGVASNDNTELPDLSASQNNTQQPQPGGSPQVMVTGN